MKIIINPAYFELSNFIEQIPSIFPDSEGTIYKGRNELKIFDVNGIKIVVKSFKIPHFINKIAYTFFRASKAERSYEYSLKLNEKGINTPVPIAYILEKKYGLLSRSFYISSYCDYAGLLRELRFRSLDEVKDFVESFAHFTAVIHNKDVLHIDYSPGNIMYENVDGQYHFCLVDINRMRFGKVDMDAGCYNLRRLWATDEVLAHIAKIYAQDRGFDEDKCMNLALKYFRKFWEKQERKKRRTKN